MEVVRRTRLCRHRRSPEHLPRLRRRQENHGDSQAAGGGHSVVDEAENVVLHEHADQVDRRAQAEDDGDLHAQEERVSAHMLPHMAGVLREAAEEAEKSNHDSNVEADDERAGQVDPHEEGAQAVDEAERTAVVGADLEQRREDVERGGGSYEKGGKAPPEGAVLEIAAAGT